MRVCFSPEATAPAPPPGLQTHCLETVTEYHLSPLVLLPYSSRVALMTLDARDVPHNGCSRDTAWDTVSHSRLSWALSGPFVTAAVPWIDRVDFLLLTLPQLCQLAFVSEGNLVENVTLQMGKLQAFFFFFFFCYRDCEVLGNTVHSERPFRFRFMESMACSAPRCGY